MKLFYCDESGTGNEPIAVMVGILVDSHRMHITKHDWCGLLDHLSTLVGAQVTELHTRNFYAGNGVWRNVDGPKRAEIISAVFEWLTDRKHKIVYASVCRAEYQRRFGLQLIPDELNTLWRFLGFHLVLSLQKYCQKFDANKGNTLLIFDNEDREEMRFTDIILRPPAWSAEYYEKKKKQEPLDQIIDVPYFGDSQDVSLIQVADFLAYFLRRYAEIKESLVPARYKEEEERMAGWIASLSNMSIGRSFMYPKVGRISAEELFYANASKSIREIG
ncbi:MAG: DUF3800 domain-containing protein [Terracidiphilus sp.]